MIDFVSFKGRPQPQPGTVVRVHRNLTRRDGVWWSITVSRLVVGHARGVTLHDADPVVNAAAAARIADGGNREVHAWIEGTLADEPDWMTKAILAPITYSFWRAEFYYRFQPENSWYGASVVTFDEKGMAA